MQGQQQQQLAQNYHSNIHQNKTYRIINRKTKYNLTQGPQVKANPLLKRAVNQLWLIQQIKPQYYYIIALQSSDVLTKGDSLHLDKTKLKENQFWKIVKADTIKDGIQQKSYYWIIDDQKQKIHSIFANPLYDTLKMASKDLTLYLSQWEFVPIKQQEQLSGMGSIRSLYSDFVIQILDGSTKDGSFVIQNFYNGRGNQRWIFQKNQKQNWYYIRSLRSGLILAPQNGITKKGNKIVQSCFNNTDNQRWVLQKCQQNENVYKIRLKGQQSLFLGVGSNKQQSILILWQDCQKCVWKVQSLQKQ